MQETLTTAQSYYNLDLNCKDQNGKSALVVALETENWACLELLLDNGVKIGDALLYAIKNKQVNAVKILFQKMRPGSGTGWARKTKSQRTNLDGQPWKG